MHLERIKKLQQQQQQYKQNCGDINRLILISSSRSLIHANVTQYK